MDGNTFDPGQRYAAFDETWWDAFLQTTQRLTTPTVIEDALPREDTARMRRYVLDIIRDLALIHREAYGIRLWLDGELSSLDVIFDNPPTDDDTIESWSARVFGDRKFGIILNRGEKFSEPLSRSVATRLAPLLRANGMPTEGLLFTLFIGDYDNTPLGIHKDLPGKCVIHFHLGPGPKKMFTWNDGVLEDKLGYRPSSLKDVDNHLDSGVRHQIDEGDLYFMPPNMYHVGRQSGLSVAVGCWYNNRSEFDFALRLVSLLREKHIKSSPHMMLADLAVPESDTAIDTVMDLFDLPSPLDQMTFKDVIRETYRDFRLALFSNAGLRNAPIPRIDEVDIQALEAIQANNPYRMHYRRWPDASRMTLYVRGTVIELKHISGLQALIDRINTGEAVPIEEVYASSDPQWTPPLADYVIRLLHRARGIVSLYKPAA